MPWLKFLNGCLSLHSRQFASPHPLWSQHLGSGVYSDMVRVHPKHAKHHQPRAQRPKIMNSLHAHLSVSQINHDWLQISQILCITLPLDKYLEQMNLHQQTSQPYQDIQSLLSVFHSFFWTNSPNPSCRDEWMKQLESDFQKCRNLTLYGGLF